MWVFDRYKEVLRRLKDLEDQVAALQKENYELALGCCEHAYHSDSGDLKCKFKHERDPDALGRHLKHIRGTNYERRSNQRRTPEIRRRLSER